MFAVEEGGVEGLHAVNHLTVAVLLGTIQIFLVAKDFVGIHQCFVHAAMFRAEHLLHLFVGDVTHHIDAPVGKSAEEFFCQWAASVEIGIAQTSQHLVLTIEWHPATRAAELCDVASIESCPDMIEGLSADETFQAFRVVFVGILTVLHDVEAIVQFFFHAGFHVGIISGCVCQSKCTHIVTAHMTAEVETCITAPVGEVGVLLFPSVILGRGVLAESCLTDEWCHQAVGIILQ